MAKCFFTGIEQPTEEMFILNITAARKAVQKLRRQAAAVEQIMRQLYGKDEAEVYNHELKKSLTLRLFRLVTPTVAQALSALVRRRVCLCRGRRSRRAVGSLLPSGSRLDNR